MAFQIEKQARRNQMTLLSVYSPSSLNINVLQESTSMHNTPTRKRGRPKKSQGKSSVVSRQSSVFSEIHAPRTIRESSSAKKQTKLRSNSKSLTRNKEKEGTPKPSTTKTKDFEFQRVTRSRAKILDLVPESRPSSARKSQKGSPAKSTTKKTSNKGTSKPKNTPRTTPMITPKITPKATPNHTPKRVTKVKEVRNSRRQSHSPMDASQERNLLECIRGEPSPNSRIEVTSRKSSRKASTISKSTVNSKRSAYIWLKDIPPSARNISVSN